VLRKTRQKKIDIAAKKVLTGRGPIWQYRSALNGNPRQPKGKTGGDGGRRERRLFGSKAHESGN